MRRSLTILSALSASFVAEANETLWVYGVNEQTGWYDADKVDSSDYNKCWAAVSANLINWWQAQYVIPDGVPTGDAVWQKYRANALTNMSNVQVGVDWWWTGEWADTYELFGYPAFKSNSSPEYYTAMLTGYNTVEDCVYHVESRNTNLTTYLWNALQGDARTGVGLNLTGSLSHGITLWGAEFSDQYTLQALYVTDSDDNTVNSGGDLDLFRLTVEYRNGQIYLPDYWYGEVKVDSLTVLDAAATDTWGMERVYIELPTSPLSIPEPATATLSLLALAALTARRRR